MDFLTKQWKNSKVANNASDRMMPLNGENIFYYTKRFLKEGGVFSKLSGGDTTEKDDDKGFNRVFS